MSEIESDSEEISVLRDQLQQALDDKAELIEESILDKERIREQRTTIEVLTRKIREFEMSVSPLPRLKETERVKKLTEENVQLTREIDRLLGERDRLEKKLIDIKIRFSHSLPTRQNSAESTDDGNDLALFQSMRMDGGGVEGRKDSNLFRKIVRIVSNKSNKNKSKIFKNNVIIIDDPQHKENIQPPSIPI
jgi:dynactin complex subunit